jgi:hypothetical protein
MTPTLTMVSRVNAEARAKSPSDHLEDVALGEYIDFYASPACSAHPYRRRPRRDPETRAAPI